MAPFEQAQEAPAAPASMYAAARQCDSCGHIGINDEPDDKAACNTCDWRGDSPSEDKCPGCSRVGTMTSACPECGSRTSLLAEAHLLAAAPQAPAAPSIPDAWEAVPAAAGWGTTKFFTDDKQMAERWGQKDDEFYGTLLVSPLYKGPLAAPAAPAVDAVRQAVREYHHALDTRQHGGVAAGNAIDAIQAALGMEWTQGVEAAARAAQAAAKGAAS